MAPVLQWLSHSESTHHPQDKALVWGGSQFRVRTVLPTHPSPAHVAILEHRGTSKEGFPGRSPHWGRMLRFSEERKMLRASRGGGC